MVAAAAAAVGIAGCGPAAEPSGAGDPALAEFHEQDIAWTECPAGAGQCADITVPLDFANPDGETIEIAVMRVLAAGEDAPDLYVNPGGPGESGVEMALGAPAVLRKDLRAAYNIVGFDPRGVGASAPIDCVDDAALADWHSTDWDTTTAEGIAHVRQ